MKVLEIGDQFVDFDIAPLSAKSTEPDVAWSDADNDIVGNVLDAVVTVVGMDLGLEIQALNEMRWSD